MVPPQPLPSPAFPSGCWHLVTRALLVVHPRLLRPRRARLWFQRGAGRGLAQRGAQPQLAALCSAPARCERPGKGGKASGKRGKKGWGRGGKLSARETAAFWRERAAPGRGRQPGAGAASAMLPGAAERAQSGRDVSHARDASPRLCLRQKQRLLTGRAAARSWGCAGSRAASTACSSSSSASAAAPKFAFAPRRLCHFTLLLSRCSPAAPSPRCCLH